MNGGRTPIQTRPFCESPLTPPPTRQLRMRKAGGKTLGVNVNVKNPNEFMSTNCCQQVTKITGKEEKPFLFCHGRICFTIYSIQRKPRMQLNLQVRPPHISKGSVQKTKPGARYQNTDVPIACSI